MSDIADRYRRRAAALATTIAAVPVGDPRWSSPSPCEDWSAIEVVGHVVDSHGMFFGLIGRQPPTVPPLDAAGPLAAFDAVRSATLAALDDPETAGAEFDGFFGRTRWDDAVDRFISTDLVVHKWDLSRALGLDDRLDPDDVRRIHELTRGFGDAMRAPGAFGPEVEPPPDADDQDRLLAFLGRDPRR